MINSFSGMIDERSRKQREALARILSDDTMLTRDANKSFKFLAKTVANTLGVERASIWLISDDESELQCQALYERSKEAFQYDLKLLVKEFPAYFDALYKESRIYAHDAQNDPRTSEMTEGYLKPMGITSMLDAGIHIGGKLIGVICSEHVGPMREWYPDEEGFISTLGSVVSQIIINTRQKEAEEKLRESEARFKVIFQTVNEGIIYVNPMGTVLHVNEAFANYSQLRVEDIVGRNVIHLVKKYITVRQIPRMMKIVVDTLSGKPISSFEMEYEGKEFEFRVYRDPETKNITAVSRDVTEAKQRTRLLDRNQQSLQMRSKIAEAFVKSEGYTVFEVVLNYILKAFKCKYGFFGYIDKNGDMVCPSATREVWGQYEITDEFVTFPKYQWGGIWGDSLKNKSTLFQNDGLNVPHKHIKIKNTLTCPILSEGNVIGQIVIADRKEGFSQSEVESINDLAAYISPLLTSLLNEMHYKRELVDAKNKAEESEQLKTAFLANMSHEIRTPLNGILGFTDLIAEESTSQQERKAYSGIIKKSGERLMDTINDIIEISKIEAGQSYVKQENVNLYQVCEQLKEFFALEIEQSALDFHYHNDLENGSSVIVTDNNKLESILINLLKNAVKFTREGHIGFYIKQMNGTVRFEVEDSGIGISSDRQEAIFERFVQADTSDTRPYEGSGLGLSISMAYAKMLGGNIWVESELGKGSTFCFEMEYQPVIIENPITEQEKDLAILQKGGVLLIAEDDESSVAFLETILNRENLQYVLARNGQEAIDIFNSREDICLILMDIKMPVMNGTDATRRIRKTNKEIPIIAQTAYAFPGDKEKALEAGCNDYISKPIKRKELISRIKEWI